MLRINHQDVSNIFFAKLYIFFINSNHFMEKNQKNNNYANKRKKYTIYRKYTDIILIEEKQKKKRTKIKRQVLIRFFESAYLFNKTSYKLLST